MFVSYVNCIKKMKNHGKYSNFFHNLHYICNLLINYGYEENSRNNYDGYFYGM